MTLTTDQPTDVFRIGIGDNLLHAVAPDRVAFARRLPFVKAACRTTAVIAANWGQFRRGSAHLRGNVCTFCAWTVALTTGAVEAELAATAPDAGEAAAWARLLADPDLLVRTCRAILAAREAEETCDADHESWAHLLGHFTAHRPTVLVAEGCAEGDCDHDVGSAGCLAASTVVACPTCSVRAGAWAGEWEGQYEVTVPAPCSVLLAVAAAYPAQVRQ